jgi:predicted permease
MIGLMVLAALILLAACANLGSLFASRAADRAREVALRLALGASRGRIVQQLLTEAVLVSLCGGVLGLMGSVVLLRLLSVWQPIPRYPITVPVTPDASVYAVALVLALGSGILFGTVPVRQVLKADPYQIVKARGAGAPGHRIALRDLLLVVQIAICGVLVTSSMVALRGLERSLHGNFGFQPNNAMLVDIDLTMGGYTGSKIPAMQKRMLESLEAIPGVAYVGLTSEPPLDMGATRRSVYSDSTTDLSAAKAAGLAFHYRVSPGYFEAAGTTLLAGRAFTWHDDNNAPDVAVVNREFAARILGSVSGGVGRYFKLRTGERIQVVGIVEDGKYLNLAEDQKPAMFGPILQAPTSATWLIVRSRRDPLQLAAAMKMRLRDLDAALPVHIQTWSNEMNAVRFPTRVATVALGVLGAMGAMLSITGIFGMAAYSVSKRQRELGIRIALGARRKEVLEAALGRALKLLAVGSAAGLLLGILSARVLAAIVYQATPRDPLVLGGVVAAMLVLGLVATWIPAHRALAADPAKLLREE